MIHYFIFTSSVILHYCSRFLTLFCQVLSSLEQRIRDFHLKLLKDKETEKPVITQLKRSNIQVSDLHSICVQGNQRCVQNKYMCVPEYSLRIQTRRLAGIRCYLSLQIAIYFLSFTYDTVYSTFYQMISIITCAIACYDEFKSYFM